MDTGVTPFSQNTYDIHQVIMWVCVAIGVAVYCAMIYAFINHRRLNRTGAAEIHISTKREVFWTLISFLILITLAIPAMLDLLNKVDSTRSESTVQGQPTESIQTSNQFRVNTPVLYNLGE